MKISICLASLILAATALGQKASPFDSAIADVLLIQAPQVRKDMGISDAQRTKMNKFADGYNNTKNAFVKAEMAKAKQQGSKYKPNDGPLRSAFESMRNNILALLTPAQTKRLRELTLQNIGMAAILDETVSKALGVSAAQLTKLRAAYKDGATRTRTIEGQAEAPIQKEFAAKQPKSQAERDALAKQYDSRMRAAVAKVTPQLEKIKADTKKTFNAVLTAKQQASWTAMLGKILKA